MDILTNETKKSSDYFSRYNGLSYYYNKLDKKYQLQLKSWLKDTNNYTTYTAEKGDTWDSIALVYYNNPTYYWVICDFNKVLDPFKEPQEGDTILIPAIGKDLEFEVY